MHPAKDILPISLKKVDQDFRPEELPENTFPRVQNVQPILYG